MHFITAERNAHDTEQAELRTREENTQREQAKAFERLIKDGQLIFKALASETALTAKNLEHITGGDEYCWLVPESPQPVGLGGDPAYQGDGWWQLGLKNSGKVVLPTCDLRFMPFPTAEELKANILPSPPMLFYHFDKVPVMGRTYYRTTPNYIRGDRIYSGVIETPTHSFIEVIKFEPDPKNKTRFIPNCMVALPSGKKLEMDCNPAKVNAVPVTPVHQVRLYLRHESKTKRFRRRKRPDHGRPGQCTRVRFR
jgi:hypothetical protein